MKNKLKLTLLDEHKSALEAIAATHKCIALMGPHVGKPSVSALLVAIAAGALSVVDGRMSRDDLASALAADRLEVEKYHAGIAKSGSKNPVAVAKNQDKKPSIRGPLTVAKIPGWVPVGGWNHCGISYLESPKYLARQDSRGELRKSEDDKWERNFHHRTCADLFPAFRFSFYSHFSLQPSPN